MQPSAIVALLGVVVGLAACDADTSGAVAALEARVAALERREPRAAPTDPEAGPDAGTGGRVERLDADLRSLERRLTEVEADLALLRDTAGAGDADVEGRRERRAERRDRMRELTATYRDRLAEVRRQYRDDPTDPERQRALRDVVEWYRSERRALMRAE